MAGRIDNWPMVIVGLFGLVYFTPVLVRKLLSVRHDAVLFGGMLFVVFAWLFVLVVLFADSIRKKKGGKRWRR